MYLIAVLLGLLEGLTEFVPVSSTGHLILAGHMLNFVGPTAESFEIFIQLGAILAVVFYYRERFLCLIPGRTSKDPETGASSQGGLAPGVAPGTSASAQSGFQGWRGIGLLGITTLPALIVGKLAHHYIHEHLFSPTTVAMGLVIGGIGLILVERIHPARVKTSIHELDWKDALTVGLFQCLALWPGMSRSGSTLIGGILGKIDRKTTAEYSFLAAVPIMFAATAYDLLKSRDALHVSDLPMFAVGFLVSMVSAWFAIRVFIRFIANHKLQGFGWYRLILAAFAFWYFQGH